jgi:hypothetical protein
MKRNAQQWNDERSTKVKNDEIEDEKRVSEDLRERKRRHESEMGASGSFVADLNRSRVARI